MRFAVIFLLIIFVMGCSNQNLSQTDEALVENMHEQMLNVNQLITELDLLLIEFQKYDELPEAIEMMETANKEAKKILEALKTLKTEDSYLTEFKSKYEAALLHYVDGLQLQIKGMEKWDGQKTTEGFKQTELAKKEINQYFEEIKKSFK